MKEESCHCAKLLSSYVKFQQFHILILNITLVAKSTSHSKQHHEKLMRCVPSTLNACVIFLPHRKESVIYDKILLLVGHCVSDTDSSSALKSQTDTIADPGDAASSVRPWTRNRNLV